MQFFSDNSSNKAVKMGSLASNLELGALSESQADLDCAITTLSQEITSSQQYQVNAEKVINQISLFKQVLSSIRQLIEVVLAKMELVITQLDHPTTCQSVAVDLRQTLKELLNLSNTQDQNGGYLFSGCMQNIPPFYLIDQLYEYQGTQETILLAISPQHPMEFTLNGLKLFAACSKTTDPQYPENIFNQLMQLIQVLNDESAQKDITRLSTQFEEFKSYYHMLNEYLNELEQRRHFIYSVIQQNQCLLQEIKDKLQKKMSENREDVNALINAKLEHLNALNETFIKIKKVLLKIIVL